MAGGGETGHVDADFGDDHPSRDLADARDGAQARDGLAKGLEAVAHLRVDGGDGGVEGVGLGEMQAQQQLGGHPPAQGRDDVGPRGADPGAHPAGQGHGFALAPGDRVEDGRPALAHDVRQNRAELDVGRVQELVDALDVARLLADQLLSWVRVRSRSACTAGGGTKLARIRPCAKRSASHMASFTSVLRPGTFFTCAALAKTRSSSSASTAHTGFQ